MMDVEKLYETLKKAQEAKGFFLNKDRDRVFELLEALLVNKERYGYMACPCRLAAGEREADLDIICPCDYRDADLGEFGACYCALYVAEDVLSGERELEPIPERRSPDPSQVYTFHQKHHPHEKERSLQDADNVYRNL